MKLSNRRIILFFLIVSIVGCKHHEKQLKKSYTDIKVLYITSMALANSVQTVWSKAIYDKDYVYDGKKDYVSDFNVAISKLMSEPEVIRLKISIDSIEKAVKSEMINQNDVSTKEMSLYNEITSVYSDVHIVSKMATSPDGSLLEYGQNLNMLKNKIEGKFAEMEIKNKLNP